MVPDTGARDPRPWMTRQQHEKVHDMTRRDSFLRGLLVAFGVPGLVLFATSMGYGALARDSGFELAQALLITAAFYALPAQVIFVDLMARGTPVVAVAFVIALTAIRLLPMTVSLMPYLRDPAAPRWLTYVIAHFVAVTAWIEGVQRLPRLPEHARLLHYGGIGVGMLSATLLGSAIGFGLAVSVPAVIAAALLFVTPTYFLLSLLTVMRTSADAVAIVLGVVLGPFFYVMTPGFDLLLTGVIGGTLAFAVGRWRS